MDWSTLPLAYSSLERDAFSRRDPQLIARLRENPATRLLIVHDRQLAVNAGSPRDAGAEAQSSEIIDDSQGHQDRSPWVDWDVVDVAALEAIRAVWVYVGKVRAQSLGAEGDGDVDVLTAVLPREIPTTSGHGRGVQKWVDETTFMTLRDLADLANTDLAGVVTPAIALANWHDSAKFCGRCGGLNAVTQSGWSRTCGTCRTEIFPRMDPAVIMAIVDDSDRILLGNSSRWPQGRYSTLAGFVEPGESLENAVRREVHEESNIEVGEVRYMASQPWPFPASLMLGFFGKATSTDITVDEDEIRTADWFTRQQVVELCGAGQMTLPGKTSIARALIDTWMRGESPF